MRTFAILTTLVLSLLHVGRAQTNVELQPVNYLQMQREIRWSAQEALVNAQRIQLSEKPSRDAVVKMQSSLREALDAATALTIQLPYESFNSAEGNQLMQTVVRLAALRAEVKGGEATTVGTALLKKIQGLCEELAE